LVIFSTVLGAVIVTQEIPHAFAHAVIDLVCITYQSDANLNV